MNEVISGLRPNAAELAAAAGVMAATPVEIPAVETSAVEVPLEPLAPISQPE